MRSDNEKVYRYRDANLEGSLILYPFSKIVVVGSSLGPMSSPTIGSWADIQYQACVVSFRVLLKSNHKAVTPITDSIHY